MNRFAFLFFFLPGLAFAHEGVRVENAWSPPSLNQPNAVGFLTLNASAEDALIGVESDCCKIVELHEMTMKDDVMRMRRVKSIPLPDHEDVQLESGGYHLMLIGLKQPLEVGDEVPVTLNFTHAAPIETVLRVKQRGAAEADSHRGHH